MINLITGSPGAGKTSLLVSMLMEREDLKNRPLFVDGIPDLKIEHFSLPENCDMTTWHEWAPTGAILVIDECQRIFRPRSAGSKVPEFVAQLETHRHKGIDFFLLTQHPRLIDINVRTLVGNHKHISMTNLGIRRITEWQRCANPEQKSELENGLTSIFKLKKQAFGMYRSAEEHTKIKVKKSFWLYGLPLAMLFVLFFLWKSYHFVDSMSHQTENKINANRQTDQEIHQPKSGSLKQETPNLPTTGNLKPEEFKPSIDGKPWTRPIYNEINRRFVAMEFPSGCVINQKSDQCHCYTEQGTLLRELDDGLCRDYAINGIFNPYKNPMKEGNHGT